MVPLVAVKVLELVIPPLMQIVVNHYSKRDPSPENQAKLDAHKNALEALKPKT